MSEATNDAKFLGIQLIKSTVPTGGRRKDKQIDIVPCCGAPPTMDDPRRPIPVPSGPRRDPVRRPPRSAPPSGVLRQGSAAPDARPPRSAPDRAPTQDHTASGARPPPGSGGASSAPRSARGSRNAASAPRSARSTADPDSRSNASNAAPSVQAGQIPAENAREPVALSAPSHVQRPVASSGDPDPGTTGTQRPPSIASTYDPPSTLPDGEPPPRWPTPPTSLQHEPIAAPTPTFTTLPTIAPSATHTVRTAGPPTVAPSITPTIARSALSTAPPTIAPSIAATNLSTALPPTIATSTASDSTPSPSTHPTHNPQISHLLPLPRPDNQHRALSHLTSISFLLAPLMAAHSLHISALAELPDGNAINNVARYDPQSRTLYVWAPREEGVAWDPPPLMVKGILPELAKVRYADDEAGYADLLRWLKEGYALEMGRGYAGRGVSRVGSVGGGEGGETDGRDADEGVGRVEGEDEGDDGPQRGHRGCVRGREGRGKRVCGNRRPEREMREHRGYGTGRSGERRGNREPRIGIWDGHRRPNWGFG